MPATRDYYSILQVNPAASAATIDAAYERLSKLYDPDTSQKRRAQQRMEELDEAYEVLSDPRRRSEYDRMRAKGYRPGQAPPPAREPASGIRGLPNKFWAWLDNPYVFAGIAGGGVMIILIAIVLISLAGGGGSNEAAVLQPTPAPTVSPPTPTMPPQTPITAPDKPPEVTAAAVTTESGLQFITITPGAGASPVEGDVVAVNYTGWLASDGTKFDSSLERSEAFGFTIGTGQVIEGWDEGLQMMQKGGKYRLIIPPDLAYGAAGRPPQIPADATLIFDIDLVDLFPAATPAPTESPAAEVSPGP